MSRTTASGPNSWAARDGGDAAGGGAHLPALVAQGHREQLGEVGLVVDDEHPHGAAVGALERGSRLRGGSVMAPVCWPALRTVHALRCAIPVRPVSLPCQPPDGPRHSDGHSPSTLLDEPIHTTPEEPDDQRPDPTQPVSSSPSRSSPSRRSSAAAAAARRAPAVTGRRPPRPRRSRRGSPARLRGATPRWSGKKTAVAAALASAGRRRGRGAGTAVALGSDTGSVDPRPDGGGGRTGQAHGAAVRCRPAAAAGCPAGRWSGGRTAPAGSCPPASPGVGRATVRRERHRAGHLTRGRALGRATRRPPARRGGRTLTRRPRVPTLGTGRSLTACPRHVVVGSRGGSFDEDPQSSRRRHCRRRWWPRPSPPPRRRPQPRPPPSSSPRRTAPPRPRPTCPLSVRATDPDGGRCRSASRDARSGRRSRPAAAAEPVHDRRAARHAELHLQQPPGHDHPAGPVGGRHPRPAQHRDGRAAR